MIGVGIKGTQQGKREGGRYLQLSGVVDAFKVTNSRYSGSLNSIEYQTDRGRVVICNRQDDLRWKKQVDGGEGYVEPDGGGTWGGVVR